MELKECQKLAAEIVDKIDKKFNVERDAQLNLSQLIEELGELARALNSDRLRGRKPGRGGWRRSSLTCFCSLRNWPSCLEWIWRRRFWTRSGS